MAAVRQSHSVLRSAAFGCRHMTTTGTPAGLVFGGDDERALFDERAAIREFDGGLPRTAAERLASLDILRARGGAE